MREIPQTLTANTPENDFIGWYNYQWTVSGIIIFWGETFLLGNGEYLLSMKIQSVKFFLLLVILLPQKRVSITLEITQK